MVYSYLRSFIWFKCKKKPPFLTHNHMQIHWPRAGLHKFNILCFFFFLYGKFSVSVIYSVSLSYLVPPATGWSGSLEVSSTCAYTSDTCLFCKSVPPWNVHHAATNTVTGQCKPRNHCNFLTLYSPSTSTTQQASGVVTDLQNSEKLLRYFKGPEKSPKNFSQNIFSL